jgi:hypothetical protein
VTSALVGAHRHPGPLAECSAGERGARRAAMEGGLGAIHVSPCARDYTYTEVDTLFAMIAARLRSVP